MFDIYLTSEVVPESETTAKAVYGKIHIGNYVETFVSSLAVWGREQYRASWTQALQRVADGVGPAALITSYVKPKLPDDFLIWWPLYPVGETVYVRNELLFYRQLRTPFSLDHPWESVRERQVTNAEGIRISEWVTTTQSIRECLERKLPRVSG